MREGKFFSKGHRGIPNFRYVTSLESLLSWTDDVYTTRDIEMKTIQDIERPPVQLLKIRNFTKRGKT